MEELFQKGQFREVLEASRGSSDPQILLLHARAALELGQAAYCREVLERADPFADPALEADRLTGLGWAYLALGDRDTHQRLARQAVQVYPSYATFFQLAHTFSPGESIAVLREAQAHASNLREEGQVALALAITLEKLGRLKEALNYASLAFLRIPGDPEATIVYARLSLIGGDQVVLDDLIILLEPISLQGDFRYRVLALNLLIDIYLLQGRPQRSLELLEQVTALLGRDHLPMVVPVAVRVYLALGQRDRAMMVVQAAQSGTLAYPIIRGNLQLALGLAVYPSPEAEAAFAEALRLYAEEMPLGALIAQGYLAALRREMLDQESLAALDQWSRNALRLYPALEQVTQRKGYRLRALGEGRLVGPEGVVQLTPRGLELLVLMLSRPQGWEREALSEALYGIDRPRAFKSEIYRLKKVLGEGLQPKPWRVTLAVTADFQELRQYLKRGEVAAALRVYQGALLPHSDAPGLEELRAELAEELRQVVMASNDPNPMFALIDQFADDLELLERLREALPLGDWRGLVVLSRIRRLRKSYSG